MKISALFLLKFLLQASNLLIFSLIGKLSRVEEEKNSNTEIGNFENAQTLDEKAYIRVDLEHKVWPLYLYFPCTLVKAMDHWSALFLIAQTALITVLKLTSWNHFAKACTDLGLLEQWAKHETKLFITTTTIFSC